jgi:ACDE family multidrug resistance protein
MAVSVASVAVGVGRTPPAARAERVSLMAPLRALAEHRLLAGAVIALLYNFGFFMLLAYTPLPLDLGVHELGAVFFGWGLLVALGAIFCAPALTARLPRLPLLGGAFALLSIDLLIIGLGIHDKGVMIVAIIASGLVLGIANAVLSNLLLGLSSADTSIAASGTNFVRFAGGAIAPFLAGKLSEHVNAQTPLYVGSAAVAAGVVLLWTFRSLLAPARTVEATDDAEAWELEMVG